MTQINIGHSYYPKSPVLPSQHSTKKINQIQKAPSSFAQQLQQELLPSPIRFSQHAKARLEERGIDLSTAQVNKLQEGMLRAKEKGSRESLLLMEGLAFVVSVRNNTVITAMEQNSMADQIVTNIDSAVLL